MHLRVDPSSSTPLYAQVVEQIRSLTLTGALLPGDRLPTVREMAKRQRINRNTAAKAYALLEAEGLLETRRGQGTFVAATLDPGDRASHRDRVIRFVDRILVEAAGLGLSPSELSTEVTRASTSIDTPSSAASHKGASR